MSSLITILHVKKTRINTLKKAIQSSKWILWKNSKYGRFFSNVRVLQFKFIFIHFTVSLTYLIHTTRQNSQKWPVFCFFKRHCKRFIKFSPYGNFRKFDQLETFSKCFWLLLTNLALRTLKGLSLLTLALKIRGFMGKVESFISQIYERYSEGSFLLE